MRIPVKLDTRSGLNWTAVGAKRRGCVIISLGVQFGHKGFIQASGMTIVDILDGCSVPEFGGRDRSSEWIARS